MPGFWSLLNLLKHDWLKFSPVGRFLISATLLKSSDIASDIASSFGGRPLPESLNVEIPLKASAWCCRIIRSIEVSGIERFLDLRIQSTCNTLLIYKNLRCSRVVSFWKVAETRNSPINIEFMHHRGSLQKSIIFLHSSNFEPTVRSVLTITYPKQDANYCSPSENDSVQRVKAGMKGIGIELWTLLSYWCPY